MVDCYFGRKVCFDRNSHSANRIFNGQLHDLSCSMCVGFKEKSRSCRMENSGRNGIAVCAPRWLLWCAEPDLQHSHFYSMSVASEWACEGKLSHSTAGEIQLESFGNFRRLDVSSTEICVQKTQRQFLKKIRQLEFYLIFLIALIEWIILLAQF